MMNKLELVAVRRSCYSLTAMVAFLAAVWLIASILSFSLVVPAHGPSGYGVTPPLADEGDETIDEL